MKVTMSELYTDLNVLFLKTFLIKTFVVEGSWYVVDQQMRSFVQITGRGSHKVILSDNVLFKNCDSLISWGLTEMHHKYFLYTLTLQHSTGNYLDLFAFAFVLKSRGDCKRKIIGKLFETACVSFTINTFCFVHSVCFNENPVALKTRTSTEKPLKFLMQLSST